MLIENSDALKKYLMESLGRISDADPGALSRYILALLKKPRSEADLKLFFLDQLEVFLMKNTAKFVEQLFEAIKSKSYLPALPPPLITHTSVPKPEKCESSEKDSQSSESQEKVTFNKSRRREKTVCQTGIESHNKKKLVTHTSLSSSRSRSSSPEKNSYIKSRDREKDPLSTHIYETLKEGASYLSLKNREVMPLKKALPEPVHSLPNTIAPDYTVQPRNEKLSKRCKDYDERGYCLLGDSCCFNHGLDPLIVEDVSVLNFAHVLNDSVKTSLSVCEEKEAPLPPPPPPPPPTSPPPLPPPLPATGVEYIPEPYNPECPAICVALGGEGADSYYSVSLQRSFQVPSLIPQKPPSSSIRVQNSKPVRSRELIGVPTVDDCKKGEKDESQLYRKRKRGFDYNRLGPKKPRKEFFPESTDTLELRRVPASVNTITGLHNHFSTFGKILNIQVCYEDDPEASLVTFETAAEAFAAYKSTEAVLNNRFIKVFLHDSAERDKRVEKNKDIEKDRNICEKKRREDNLSYMQRDFPRAKKGPFEIIYSKGNLCKTVFLNNNKSDVPTISTEGKNTKDEREKKQSLSKLDLYKKKQEFLETLMEHQKLIVERLKAARNAKQRKFFKKLIEDFASKITPLQNELKFFFEKEKCNSKTQKSVIAEKKKELLDAEMDLYKTLSKGDDNDTSVLLRKVNELKEKAKAFGLLDPYEKTGLKMKCPKPHSFSSKNVSNFSKLLKTDNRPKQLLVSGIEDKDFAVNFLQKFPGVEKVSSVPRGCAVALNSRKAAETMHRSLNGFALGNENLIVSWFQDDQQLVSEDVKDAKEKNDSLFVDEDEDEEEDSEARSWRR